ncbi:MAG: ComEC/Rec2 family competence protein [Elusimicrobiota bacterium]
MRVTIRLSVIIFLIILYITTANIIIARTYGNKSFLDSINNKRIEVTGEVISFPRIISGSRISFLLKTKTIQNDYINKKIQVVIYEDEDKKINFGNFISVSGTLKSISVSDGRYTPKEIKYQLKDYCIGNYSFAGRGSFWRMCVQKTRQGIINKFMKTHRVLPARFLSAILLGEKNLLKKEEVNALRNSGMSHILAVSGLHVGILMGAILLLFGFRKNRISCSVIIIACWLYVFISGFSPSCVRAAVMLNFALLAFIFDREYNALYSLICAACMMLIFKPILIYSVGFQFSFIATFGIIYYFPIISGYLNFLPGFIRKSLAVTLGAQIALFPLIILYFHELPILSFINNMILVPFVGIMLIVGIASIIISFVSISIAVLIAELNTLMVKIFLSGAFLSSSISWWSIEIENISIAVIIIYYLCFLALPFISFPGFQAKEH